MKIRRRAAFLEFAGRALYELDRSLCLATLKPAALGAMAWNWEELPEPARFNQRRNVEMILALGPNPVPVTSPAVMMQTNLGRVEQRLVFLLLDAWERGPRQKAPTTLAMATRSASSREAYVRRPGRKGTSDLIREEVDYLVVERSNRRRVRWPADGTNEILEYGSLNPQNPNYEPGGKVLRKV